MVCIPSLLVVAVLIAPPLPDPRPAFDAPPPVVAVDSVPTDELLIAPPTAPPTPPPTAPPTPPRVAPSTGQRVVPIPEPMSPDATSPTIPEPGPAAETPAPPEPAERLELSVVPQASPVRPVVALYGDSLSWEARDLFVAELASRAPAARVAVHTMGGTALCDWLDQMRADTAGLAGGVAVVQFSGNNFTPCMLDRSGVGLTGESLVDRYRADAVAAIEVFRSTGTTVLLAGAPIVDSELNAMYAELAERHDGVVYVPAGDAVLDAGRWTATLPCRPEEPCEGGVDASGTPVNVVRAPDALHFCPTGAEGRGSTDDCPVWSSGAYRFALALAAPVIDLLGPATPSTAIP